jgi:sugar phosphate isomerase/epimerase
MHTLPLFCSLDYDAVVRALIDTGYKGTFNFEVDAPQKLLRFTEKREDLSERAQAIRLSVDKLVYELGCLILQKYNILEE